MDNRRWRLSPAVLPNNFFVISYRINGLYLIRIEKNFAEKECKSYLKVSNFFLIKAMVNRSPLSILMGWGRLEPVGFNGGRVSTFPKFFTFFVILFLFSFFFLYIFSIFFFFLIKKKQNKTTSIFH